MSDHEAAGVGETPPTAEDDDQDRYIPTSEDIEQVADGVIRYYFDLGELSDEQTQALGEARYKEIRLTDDEIEAMKAEIRGRVSHEIFKGEPPLPYSGGGEAWDLDPSILGNAQPPKLGTHTRELNIATITVFGPADDNLHNVSVLTLKMNGKSVQGLSPDKTEIVATDGSTHPSCIGADGALYQAPHSEHALRDMRVSIGKESDGKLKPKGLRLLTPEDTVELFRRTKARQPGEEIPFRDLVVERIYMAFGENAASLANDVVVDELIIAYTKAVKDPNGSQRDEVIDALRKAKKRKNHDHSAPSDAGPVEDINPPGRPANPQERKSVIMKTQQSTGTQADPRPPATLRNQAGPLPQATDLLAEGGERDPSVTDVIEGETQVRNAHASDGPEGNFTTGELESVERLCGTPLKRLAAVSKGTCQLNPEELARIKGCLDENQPMPVDVRTAIITEVRRRNKPAWKKAFEDHKAKLPYVGMAILALVVAGLLISRPSDGSVATPAAATVPTEVRTPIELVGAPVPCSQNVEGLWLIDAPMRVPSSLTHGEWRSMTWRAHTTTVALPAGQQPGVLLNSLTHVRGADGKERLEPVLTLVGEVDLTKRKLVPHEVQ